MASQHSLNDPRVRAALVDLAESALAEVAQRYGTPLPDNVRQLRPTPSRRSRGPAGASRRAVTGATDGPSKRPLSIAAAQAALSAMTPCPYDRLPPAGR